MRRLPVYFVIDVSESMVGEPIEQMERALETIVASLRQDPQCLETIYISVIAFAGQARVIAPLYELISFYPPKIPIGGGTSLGKALDVLMADIDRNVQRTTAEVKGDWNPVVFLITDGKPTDTPNTAIERWRKDYALGANMVVVTLGLDADAQMLGRLTDNVLALEHTGGKEFSSFVEWISSSIKMQSQKVEMGDGASKVSLEKAESSGLTVVDDTSIFNLSDPFSLTFTGRCATTKRPYLIKYEKVNNEGMEQFLPTGSYHLNGAFRIDESYFDWSETSYEGEAIVTSLLDGAPPCPHCGSGSAFAMCGCGKLLCVGEGDDTECPWCQERIQFGEGGGGDFSINRGQG